jgi:hypothetical protein
MGTMLSKVVIALGRFVLCLSICGGGLLSITGSGRIAGRHILDFPDVYKTRKGFNFSTGKSVNFKDGQENIASNVDLMWDVPSGLASNNPKNGMGFFGKGGIIDLGRIKMVQVKKAPQTGYLPSLTAAQIVVGHTYCILTADGMHYAKIHIIKYDRKMKKLIIAWEFQKNGSNRFDPPSGKK